MRVVVNKFITQVEDRVNQVTKKIDKDTVKKGIAVGKQVVEKVPKKDQLIKRFTSPVCTLKIQNNTELAYTKIKRTLDILGRSVEGIKKKVIAVEWDDFNLSQAQKRNSDRPNVEFIKMDLYNDAWESHLPPTADVVFIDAGHQYYQVKNDILNSLRLWDNPILIFDDYGLIRHVKTAVDEQIDNKAITFSKWIGSHRNNFIHASGAQMEADEWEGCICNLNLK